MNKKVTLRALTAATLFLSAGSAFAAGYQLNEYSATGMGRSFAGMGVVADDFSAIGFNPAGMALNETNGLQTVASAVSIYSHFEGSASGKYEKDDSRITRVLPSGFGQYKVTDAITLGLGVYVPFGLATDYPNGWFGESHGGLSQITNINISPAISWQATDMISLGVAFNAQHAKARITSSMVSLGVPLSNDLSGDDWGFGYSVGATIKPTDNLRFGLSYRSKISHTLEGKIHMSGLGAQMTGKAGNHPITAKMPTPEYFLLSGAYDWNDKWTFSSSLRYTRWSRFDKLDIKTADTSLGAPVGTNISSTTENWRNTWFFSLGADYKYSPELTLRVGAAVDQTVIRGTEFRTVRIPDGRRIWTSCGLSYGKGNWQFDVGYAHLFVDTAKATGVDSLTQDPYPVDIKYYSHADMLSFGVQYKF